MEEPPRKRNPPARLTDEVLVEILRRVPIRSLCRFKCVSRSWRNLISHPVQRKKLPQTLVGFFYHSWNGERCPERAHHFTNITGKGAPFIRPSFSFLPVPSDQVVLEDSCNGLLLCRCDRVLPFHYAVCNPATKKWVTLPENSWAGGVVRTARLGFDPAVSSHFHVVDYLVDDDERVIGVEIYSSKTGAWSFKESEWGDYVALDDSERGVFLNGFMHMFTFGARIMVVDMEGKTWRSIQSCLGCWIHQSQGRLCFVADEASKLSIWTLEDHGTHEWTLKHSVRKQFLFRQENIRSFGSEFRVIAFHPECNLIYFVYGWDTTLMAYEMDRKEVRVIPNLGHDSWLWCHPYLPYIPLFSESLADEH